VSSEEGEEARSGERGEVRSAMTEVRLRGCVADAGGPESAIRSR
jgi:hypothetical protein